MSIYSKPVKEKKMWAYFDPFGCIIFRTISSTRRATREEVSRGREYTWKDYEKVGYYLKKVIVDIYLDL